MTPGGRLRAYVGALLVLGVLDALWLGLLSRGFYQREIGALLADEVAVVPAVVFYLLYPLGVAVLALGPQRPAWTVAAARGALLGLVAYGAYDLTNLATLRGWSLRVVVVDMAWGAGLTAAAAIGAWWAAGRRPA